MGCVVDITNQRFGKLTVIKRVENSISKSGYQAARWLCKCDCGNEIVVRGNSIRSGHVTSCGCLRKPDLTGKKFGKLTVLRKTENKKHSDCHWEVLCDCGNIVEVSTTCLLSGHTKSCGCLLKEINESRNGLSIKKNDYIVFDTYVIMYTTKNEPFLVDVGDFGKVYKHYWYKGTDGYFESCINGKHIGLHKYIMDCPNGMIVDHKHGSDSLFDNRRSNLRIGTYMQNAYNRKTRSDNVSGVTGVYYDKKNKKWVSCIGVNGKNVYLGSYKNFEDAVISRKNAEEEYYGEWSHDNSRNKKGEVV